jgi:hypothetical protein
MSKAEFLAGIREARAELATILDLYDQTALAPRVIPGLQ